MIGFPELLVCFCVIVTAGGMTLLASQIIPASEVEEADGLVVVMVVSPPFGAIVVIVVGPPLISDGSQTTLDR